MCLLLGRWWHAGNRPRTRRTGIRQFVIILGCVCGYVRMSFISPVSCIPFRQNEKCTSQKDFFSLIIPTKTSCRRCRWGAITPSPPRRSTASLQTQSLTTLQEGPLYGSRRWRYDYIDISDPDGLCTRTHSSLLLPAQRQYDEMSSYFSRQY